jgi:toxin ParE1/3/4
MPELIRFTPTARKQYLDALAYIHRDRPSAAKAFRDRSEKTLRRLVSFPDSGRKIPEFPHLEYREVVIAPYRLFYKIEDSVVWVVAVWHDRQLPKEPRK